MSMSGPGQLLFAFVRHWSHRAAQGNDTIAEQGRLVLVTEAVSSLVARGEPATVNAVACELGIDQSGASRLIRCAADAAYLTMTKAPTDARRRQLAVTAAGRAALHQAHKWQEAVFAELTVNWGQQRRDEFQLAMTDLMTGSSAMAASAAPLPRQAE
jgi:DNA-binding MarR family transcriptional regulator